MRERERDTERDRQIEKQREREKKNLHIGVAEGGKFCRKSVEMLEKGGKRIFSFKGSDLFAMWILIFVYFN